MNGERIISLMLMVKKKKKKFLALFMTQFMVPI